MNACIGWDCDDSDEEWHGLIEDEKPLMEPMPTKLPNSDITDHPLKISSHELHASKNEELPIPPTSLNISEKHVSSGIDNVIETSDSSSTAIVSTPVRINVPESNFQSIHSVEEEDEKFEVEEEPKKVNASKLIGAGLAQNPKNIEDERTRVLELFQHPLKIEISKTALDELPTIQDASKNLDEEKPKTELEKQVTIQETSDKMEEEKGNEKTDEVTKTYSSEVDPNVNHEKKTTSNSDKNFKNKLSNVKKGKRRLPALNKNSDYEFKSEEDDVNRAKRHKFQISFI